MCGIVGIINADSRPVEREILTRMNEAIIHRGPDEDGFHVHENVGLAMRRLSIIDLKSGQQPIYNRDKTACIVFNGEIYNFQQLRDDLERENVGFDTRSDTEVILQLYVKYGIDCVNYLRGMFAFAIWDEKSKSLFAARDRIGKKPLLYSHQPNGDLVFGSEFRAMLQHPVIGKTVDYGAIHDYLSYYCVPAPQTAFKQIRKLEPAHWLLWKDGEIRTERYWQPDFSKKIKISQQDAEDETVRIVSEATKMRLISEVPLGAFLSGGVDSSLIVSMMARLSSDPVKTFSIGFREADFSELEYARKVAKHIGAEHYEFIVEPDAVEVLPTLVDHYGEPYADPSAIATYYVARETRKHVTVALNGDGGDESFGGYKRYTAMLWAERYSRLPELVRKKIIGKFVESLPKSEIERSRTRDVKRFLRSASLNRVERYFKWVCAFDGEMLKNIYTKDFADRVSGIDASRLIGSWFARGNGLGVVDLSMFTDQMTYLPNDLLAKVDIASMAVSLEARSPLLDHKLIEFAASLPEAMKFRGAGTKRFLKKVASHFVPREVIYRRKMGFSVPMTHWFRGELGGFLRDTLLCETSLRRGLFRPDVVRKMVEDHISGKQDSTTQLYTLLMLELWFQRFID